MIHDMNEADLREALEWAARVVEDAGRFVSRGADPVQIAHKHDHTLVTSVDHAIQACVLEQIAARYPDHAVAAEEAVREPRVHANRAEARYCWVLDPLDGTRNYVHGVPCFSTALALLDNGVPIVACVYEHVSGRMYAAMRKGGTTLDGRSVAVADPPEGQDCLIGFPSAKDAFCAAAMARWTAQPGIVGRNLGSTAMHLALVSCGAFAGAFCKKCKLWDVAAGSLLVTEAGGVVTTPAGDAAWPFSLAQPGMNIALLAGAPRTHRRLADSIRDVGERRG